VFTPKYPDKALNNVLKQLFPGFFKDLKIPMFVTVADLNNRSLKVMFSGDPLDGVIPLWEVIRQAVAAETYFLPYRGLGDGGIYANDPVMVGIAGAQSKLGVDPEEVEICSIGTGQRSYNEGIGTTNNWSMLRWGGYILNSLLDGASSTMHEFFATQLALKRYQRIQFLRGDNWDMDDPSMVEVARKAWAADIIKAIPAVEAF
jgi:patatin-like phospholipase/acyl hydrolase